MTAKEYNEWRKEFGRVQVLLYAFPNVLKKIGNEDLIKELKILGYDEHTLDFLNSAMDAFEKAEKEELMKDMNVQPDPDTIPVPKKIPIAPEKPPKKPSYYNFQTQPFYLCGNCIHTWGVDCFRDHVNDIPCPNYRRDLPDGGFYG